MPDIRPEEFVDIEQITQRETLEIPQMVGGRGPLGRSLELQTTETHIQWRIANASPTDTWKNLVALTAIQGPDGTPATEPEFGASATHLQWRLEGGEWADLVPLAELKGPQGDAGADGVQVHIGDTPPEDPNDLWVDTSDESLDPLDTQMAAVAAREGGVFRASQIATIASALEGVGGAWDLAAMGDSITAAGQTDVAEGIVISWAALASEYASFRVANPSVPGERQGDIATRFGCIIEFTVPGGVIPASTDPFTVTLVEPAVGNFIGSDDGGPQSAFVGTFLGVPVSVFYDKTVWTMARTTAAAQSKPVPTSGGAFRVTSARGVQHAILVSNGGRNGSSTSLVSQTRRMIQLMPEPRRVLLIPPLRRTASSAEDTGLADLAAEFPEGVNYLDLRSYLAAHGMDDEGLTPTAQDEIDIAAGIVPASLYTDGIHPNAAGQRAIARRILEVCIELGWIEAQAVSIPPRVIPLPTGPTKLWIPSSGPEAVIASSTALQEAQQLEIIMHVDPIDDLGSTSRVILRRNALVEGVTNNAMAIQTLVNGVIRTQFFATEAPGGSASASDTSVAPTWPAGAFTLRGVLQTNPRQVSWYLGPDTSDFDSISWTAIGTVPVTGSATSIFPKNVPLRLNLPGSWYRLLIKTGSTVILDQDFTEPGSTYPGWAFTGGAGVVVDE